MTSFSVFLADDHPIFRAGLRSLLQAEDINVVGEAADGRAAILEIVRLRPHVAIVDVSMPGVSGTVAMAEVRRAAPEVKLLALSAHEDLAFVQQALAAGALGYVIKRAAPDDLVRAVRVVSNGETYLDPLVGGNLMARLVRSSREDGQPCVALSRREAAVLREVALGYPAKEIAATLGISARTIETYKVRAMEKLGLQSRADLVRYGIQNGWFSDPPHTE